MDKTDETISIPKVSKNILLFVMGNALKKNGYKEQVVIVAETNGEMDDLNIELLKNR